MKKTISLTLALLIALMPNTNVFASQSAEENLQQIIENAKSKLDNGSLEELIKAIESLSNGIVEYEQVKDIKSLKLKGELNKSTYYLGEKIDLSGVTLIAKFDDGVDHEIPLDNIKESDIYLKSLIPPFEIIPYSEVTVPATYMLALKFGNFYALGDAYVTMEQKPISLESISIKSMPKTEYTQGEQLDITGLVVEGTYSDGTKKIIDSSLLNLTGFDTNKLGEQTLTIRFDDKTVTYIVNVKKDEKPEESDSIKIERLLYTPKGGFSGEITVILNEATQTKLDTEDFSVHCPGLSEMTIVGVSTYDNKTYKLSTPSYFDNNYILEIYFNDKTLEGNFVVKSNCPIISYPYTTRVTESSAKFKFNSDEQGTMYYLVREVNPNLRANNNIPGVNEMEKGSSIKVGPNEVAIDYTLEANKSYELFYISSKGDSNKSVVYGPVKIDSEVEKMSTSDITIVKAEAKMSDGTQDVVITLSKATEVPLTLEAFKIVCPAAATLRFDEIINGSGADKNKVYTLKMRGGFYDNNYELTVNFPDGTYTKTSFRCQLGTPNLTAFEITRTSETEIKIVFESSMDGAIYYGFSEEKYNKLTYDEVLTSAPKQKIHVGKNTLRLDNIPNDSEKFFYWISENGIGNKNNYVEGAGNYHRVPTNIEQEEPPEQESKIKIEDIELVNRYEWGIKFTLSEDMGGLGLVNYKITFEGDNGSLPERYMSVGPYSYNDNKVFFMNFMRYPLSKGTYTLRIEFDDGVAKKDITFTEDINK